MATIPFPVRRWAMHHRDRWPARLLTAAVVFLPLDGSAAFLAPEETEQADRPVLGISLGQLAPGDAKLIELTYPLINKSRFSPDNDYQRDPSIVPCNSGAQAV